MLQINDLSKAYGDTVVLQGVNLLVNPGERVGLVGPNGCGKTTLLEIVVGRETPDRGSVSFSPPGLRLGYLEQALIYPADATIRDAMRGESGDPEQDVQKLAARMSTASGEELERLMAAYGRALDRLETGDGYRVDGYRVAAQIDVVLAGLGL
jgi:ATPase subunit of ABC transporter with duplicated ATPase domains